MKLTFWAGVGGREVPIKLHGEPFVPVKWSKLHWVPTDEDWRSSRRFFGLLKFRQYRSPKWIPDLYTDFTTLCMPDNALVYGLLNAPWGLSGFYELRKNLDESGLHYLVLSKQALIAEIRREHVAMVFKEGSWRMAQHFS